MPPDANAEIARPARGTSSDAARLAVAMLTDVPRPHAVAHNEQYRPIIRAYMVRHKVRPGITGWAQVNGCRGETDVIEKMEARVAYGIKYLRNWSLGLDLRVIARTIRPILFDHNAY